MRGLNKGRERIKLHPVQRNPDEGRTKQKKESPLKDRYSNSADVQLGLPTQQVGNPEGGKNVWKFNNYQIHFK